MPPQNQQQPTQPGALPETMIIHMPDGTPRRFEAGTPIAAIKAEGQRIRHKLSLQGPGGQAEATPMPGQELSPGAMLGPQDQWTSGDTGNLLLDALQLALGMVPGPVGDVQAVGKVAKAGRALARRLPRPATAARAAATRIAGPAAVEGVQTQISGEDPTQAIALEGLLGAAGEVAPSVIRMGADALVPIMGLAGGRGVPGVRAGARAAGASRRRAAATHPLDVRPLAGNVGRMDRQVGEAASDVHALTAGREAVAGREIPGRDILGTADQIKAAGKKDPFSVTRVAEPVEDLEQEFIDNQVAQRVSEATGMTEVDALAEVRRTQPPAGRRAIFNRLKFGTQEVADFGTSQAKTVDTSFSRRSRGEPRLSPSERLEGDWGTGLARKMREETANVIDPFQTAQGAETLSGARSRLSDLKSMQEVSNKLRTGLGAVPIRGAGGYMLGGIARALTGGTAGAMSGIDPAMLATFAAMADPALIGPVGELLATAAKASPSVARGYDVSEDVKQAIPGLRRRERR